jgi:hypothetical protein
MDIQCGTQIAIKREAFMALVALIVSYVTLQLQKHTSCAYFYPSRRRKAGSLRDT